MDDRPEEGYEVTLFDAIQASKAIENFLCRMRQTDSPNGDEFAGDDEEGGDGAPCGGRVVSMFNFRVRYEVPASIHSLIANATDAGLNETLRRAN